MAQMVKPRTRGSTSAWKRRAPLSASRRSRSATAGGDSPTRRPSSATRSLASPYSSTTMRRSMSSSGSKACRSLFRCSDGISLHPLMFCHSFRRTTFVGCIREQHRASADRSRPPDRRHGTAAAAAAPGIRTAVVLCGQRGVPLPRPGVCGAAVRPPRRARGGMAADRDRGGGVRGVASPLAVTPVGLGGALAAFAHPVLLLAGVGVGLCSSVIPYVTDQLAMARLPRASFALLLALLPMLGTIIGAIVLRQPPTGQDLLGIALVVGGVALHHPDRGA